MSTGKRIRQARRLAEVSVVDLARCLGISRQQLGRIEAGQSSVRADWLPVIAGRLGVATADLVDPAVDPGAP